MANRIMAVIFVLGVLLAAVAYMAVDARQIPERSSQSVVETAQPNVLLVVIDTLRADRVAAQRNGQAVMPNLHAFAQQSQWFTRAYSAATWTKPSVTSILTGLYPETHRVQYGVQKAWFEGQDMTRVETLPKGTPTLSTLLKAQGYRTGTIQTNQHLTQAMGYGEGVDSFEFYFAQPAGLITDRALEFVGKAEGPWFLLAQYIDPHAGYNPPEPHRSHFGPLPALTPEETEWLKDENYHTGYYIDRVKYDVGQIEQRQYGSFSPSGQEAIRQLYDGECHYTDHELDRLLDAVQRDYPNTIIIITADHGEEFWEHGSIGHAKTVYDEVARVPLIVRAPGVAAGVVEAPVGSIDIAPTVAKLTNISALPTWQGRDLFDPEAARPVVYSSTKGSIKEFGLDAAAAVRWPHKLVDDRKRQSTKLFDLSADPTEQSDIGDGLAEVRDGLLQELKSHREMVEAAGGKITPEVHNLSPEEQEQLHKSWYGEKPADNERTLTPEEIEQLRNLGYLN
jgi:arylsulfatase A-like enzyme